MNCIIIEDQAPAQRVLKKYIADIGNITLLDAFTDVPKALNFLQTTNVDLIFLDVHLPKLSGMEFLKIKPDQSFVILTTAYSDYALESYDYQVVDYLLKPFSFQRFVQAVNKVQILYKAKNQSVAVLKRDDVKEIFIKSGYEHIKLVIEEIRYIKADADYTEIQLKSKKHLSSESLKFWTNFLDPVQFTQIHKSYIVNVKQIERVTGNRAVLIGGEQLPIGRVYKDAFAERYFSK